MTAQTGDGGDAAAGWRARLTRWLRRPAMEHWLLLGLAAIMGTVSGFAAIGFYLAIDFLLVLGFGANEAQLATRAAGLSPWQILAVPVLGGLVVGQLLRFLPGHKAHAVPHVIEAAALHGSRIRLRDGLFSAAVTITSLGSGASTGREGPVVHLGATLAARLTALARLNPAIGRTLLGCGVAAAVAASFNAPIAGVFFALEVIIGHYALHTFAPIVIAAIAGTLVSHAHLGNFRAFQITDQMIATFWEFPAFVLLGVLAAGLAVLFMRGLIAIERLQKPIARHIPLALQPALGGLVVGFIAMVHPEVLSVGYEATHTALTGGYGLALLLTLISVKLVASWASFLFRFGGGVFSPSLFLGAMLGGAFGHLAGGLPMVTSAPSLYAVVGMGAVASAVLGAPISTILIVFEITGDYSVALAVMVASAVASMTARLFVHGSLFHMQLREKGMELTGGRATFLLRSETVEGHLTRDFTTITTDTPLSEARAHLLSRGGGEMVVLESSGRLAGMLALTDMPHALLENGTGDGQPVESLMRPTVPHLYSDEPLGHALTAMETTGEDVLPVVDRETGTVAGLVRYRHVLEAYNKALLEAQGEDRGL
ncbi:chloride channel protein [Yunchengibacter salinarum]|uniref:chloride channel protein n=1 Tax=Yunchengibacter salinarum TaxID=3133399 RepID=UPI0035B65D46